MDRTALRKEMTIQKLHNAKYRKLIRVNGHLNNYSKNSNLSDCIQYVKNQCKRSASLEDLSPMGKPHSYFCASSLWCLLCWKLSILHSSYKVSCTLKSALKCLLEHNSLCATDLKTYLLHELQIKSQKSTIVNLVPEHKERKQNVSTIPIVSCTSMKISRT